MRSALPPSSPAPRWRSWPRTTPVREYGGIAAKARLVAARAALVAGDAPSALARWREIAPRLGSVQPADLYLPASGAIGRAILFANRERDEAAHLLDNALRWVNDCRTYRTPFARASCGAIP